MVPNRPTPAPSPSRTAPISGTTSTGIQVGEPRQGQRRSERQRQRRQHCRNATCRRLRRCRQTKPIRPLTVNGTAGADAVVTSATSTGAIVFNGGGGDDSFTGHGETDTATYSGTLTAAAITSDGTAWHVAAGADGTDTLTGVEKVTDSSGHTFLLVGSNGGFATIQAAVNAAHDGDTIPFWSRMATTPNRYRSARCRT